MMLSDTDILAAIKEGRLTIEPYSEQCVRPSGLLLHLGYDLLKPLPGKVVDVKNKITPDYQPLRLEDDRPYELTPGEFMLGSTYENVTVGNNLGFLIEGRSTLARVGLTVVQTAMLVYAGHSGRAVTLELANNGPNSILLYPKMKIARVALFELRTPSAKFYDDEGKYKDQTTVGPPVFKNELLK